MEWGFLFLFKIVADLFGLYNIMYYICIVKLKQPIMNVTDFNALVKTATLNIKHFNLGDLTLKGCRECDKLVKHNHTNNPRFKKEGAYVYICECAECNTPMLLDGVDFYLLHNKV